MSVSTDTERIFRIGGYVKRAKLNLRNEREIRAFHRNAIERRFGDFEDGTLVRSEEHTSELQSHLKLV